MSRLGAFNSPLLLGFEHFERMLDQAAKVLGDDVRSLGSSNEDVVRRKVYESLSRFWREQLGRKPVVVPVLMEV